MLIIPTTKRSHLKNKHAANQGITTCSPGMLKNNEKQKNFARQILALKVKKMIEANSSNLHPDHTSLLTIILITDVNIIDKRWKLLDNHLSNIIVYTSSIQETHVKNIFSHSSTLVDIPKNKSCNAACSRHRDEKIR